MRCPFCGDESNKVIDSRIVRDGEEIRRRRECEECMRRFTTRERVEEVVPKIIKRDHRREDYDRRKLQRGIERACQKRPVSVEAIERLVDRIERRLQESGEREVQGSTVGERAMEELTALDALAAVRFASVYRNFQSAADYADFFRDLGLPEGGPDAEREDAAETPAAAAADSDETQ